MILKDSIRKLNCFARREYQEEDIEDFVMRGQQEIRALIYGNPGQPVDWKVVIERATQLEIQEKAIFAELQRKAELRRQREYDNRGLTCYDRLLAPCISSNKEGCVDEMQVGLLSNKFKVGSETGSNASFDENISEFSSLGGSTGDDRSGRWKGGETPFAVFPNSTTTSEPRYSTQCSV
jgi:hypothetical protein